MFLIDAYNDIPLTACRADPPSTDVLPIHMDRNLFTCNYRGYFPIDNDDGSNGYVQTNNFLLWGGSKTLMGYNKHFINNTFVYVDFSPAKFAEKMLGLDNGLVARLQ